MFVAFFLHMCIQINKTEVSVYNFNKPFLETADDINLLVAY